MIKRTIEWLYNYYNFPISFKTSMERLAQKLCQADIEQILDTYINVDNFDFQQLSAILQCYTSKYDIHRYTLNLFALVILLPRLKLFYAEYGIDNQIADDTIADIKYKYIECKKVHGVEGLSVWEGWYEQIFSLRLFQIGRLQYEYETFLFPCYEKDGKVVKKGDEILSVHIPAMGTPLSHDECVRSYEKAQKFFEKHFEGRQMTFVCWSWLLNPDNEQILDESSNIIRFKRDYDVIDKEIYPDYNVLAPWIFGRKEIGDLEPTTQDTSLQRRIKAHLKNGGKLGRGYGVFFV